MWSLKKVTEKTERVYWPVFISMKVRILKDVLVEMEKSRLDEVWDKQLRKWDEITVEKIDRMGGFAHLTTSDGDVYLHVPLFVFEELP